MYSKYLPNLSAHYFLEYLLFRLKTLSLAWNLLAHVFVMGHQIAHPYLKLIVWKMYTYFYFNILGLSGTALLLRDASDASLSTACSLDLSISAAASSAGLPGKLPNINFKVNLEAVLIGAIWKMKCELTPSCCALQLLRKEKIISKKQDKLEVCAWMATTRCKTPREWTAKSSSSCCTACQKFEVDNLCFSQKKAGQLYLFP